MTRYAAVEVQFSPQPRLPATIAPRRSFDRVQGFIPIDAERYRLASITPPSSRIGLWVGILGHLNRGGRFVIQRENIADDLWQASSLTFNFTGKLLLLKTINVSRSI
jgi:hypothetical protein